MSQYQLPPLKDDKVFEAFVCDLFNAIENTNSYQNTDFQTYGVPGQNQSGIDLLSSKTKTVIQCKVKDLRKQDEVIRTSLIKDFNSDLQKAYQLNIDFDRFILASTFRDDAPIQKHAAQVTDEIKAKANLYYWGWDTLSKHAEQYDSILIKYFPKFRPKPIKTPKVKMELPTGALGTDLAKKNYISYLIKRYGEWKQIELNNSAEKFNWASFNKHIMNRYKAAGINYIPIVHFEDLATYLQGRIDKTTFGKTRRAANNSNYTQFNGDLNPILNDENLRDLQ